MIIGAFYWAFAVFGGVLVLLGVAGAVVEVQQQPVSFGNLAGEIGLGAAGAVIATYSVRALFRGDAGFVGARAGPALSRDRMAGSGCLFVLLVVGAGLFLTGPAFLVQLPGMTPDDRASFGVAAVISSVLGALILTPSGLLLWHRRRRGPDAAVTRRIGGIVAGVIIVLVALALLVTTFVDPRFDVGPGGRLALGAAIGVGAIVTAVSGVAFRRSLR